MYKLWRYYDIKCLVVSITCAELSRSPYPHIRPSLGLSSISFWVFLHRERTNNRTGICLHDTILPFRPSKISAPLQNECNTCTAASQIWRKRKGSD